MIAGLAVNALNYAFHLIGAWGLTPQNYGLLNAILALFLLGSLLSMSLQLYFAKHWNQLPHPSTILVSLTGCLVVLTLIGWVWHLYFPWLNGFFHTNAPWLIPQAILTLLAGLLLGITRGILQARGRLTALGINLGLEPVIKIILLLLILYLTNDITWAFFSVTASIWAAWFLSLVPLRSESKFPNLKAFLGTRFKILLEQKIYSEIGKILLGISSVAIFFNLDMILAQHFLPDRSGNYAVVIRFGQVSFFLISLLSQISLSQWANQKHPQLTLKPIWISLGGLLTYAGLAFWGGAWFIGLLFGEGYATSGHLLWLSVIGFGLLGLNNHFLFWLLHQNRYQSLWLFAMGIMVFVGLVWQYHHQLYHIIYAQIFTQALLLLSVLIYLACNRRDTAKISV